jgi:hypothetical protein
MLDGIDAALTRPRSDASAEARARTPRKGGRSPHGPFGLRRPGRSVGAAPELHIVGLIIKEEGPTPLGAFEEVVATLRCARCRHSTAEIQPRSKVSTVRRLHRRRLVHGGGQQ